MSVFKSRDDKTSLSAVWSEHEYMQWQREQDERDNSEAEVMNARVLARFDPECEAAVRALEEGGWGRRLRCSGDR